MSGMKRAAVSTSPSKRSAGKPASPSLSQGQGNRAGEKRHRQETDTARKERLRREKDEAKRKAAAEAAAQKKKDTAARPSSEDSSEAQETGESDDQDADAHAPESEDSDECDELCEEADEVEAHRRLKSRTSKGDSGDSTSKTMSPAQKQVQARSSPASQKQAAASSSPESAATVSDFGHMPPAPAFCRDINPWVYMLMMRRVEGPVMEQANAAETEARLESIYTAIDIARPSGFNQARYKEAVQHFPAHLVEVTKKTKGAAQTFEKVTL